MKNTSVLPPSAPESLVEPAAPRSPSFFPAMLIALWHDRIWQLLLIVTLVANIALFVYLGVRYATLPDLLPLHFDSAGYADRIDAKSGIFALPVIGTVVFILNAGLGLLLHHRERAATILLMAGALFVQVLMWLAVVNIAGLV